MSEGTICGACQGSWPCACSDRAVPVTVMDTASELAHRMGPGRDDPLAVKPYDPDPIVRASRRYEREHYCGHGEERFDLDPDQRIVTCRNCETPLDPYWVIERLARVGVRDSMRLQACQELEKRDAVRDGERRARAAVRRHRYAPYAYKRDPNVYCATCGGQEADAIHTKLGEQPRTAR